jgi:hypothetical protein
VQRVSVMRIIHTGSTGGDRIIGCTLPRPLIIYCRTCMMADRNCPRSRSSTMDDSPLKRENGPVRAQASWPSAFPLHCRADVVFRGAFRNVVRFSDLWKSARRSTAPMSSKVGTPRTGPPASVARPAPVRPLPAGQAHPFFFDHPSLDDPLPVGGGTGGHLPPNVNAGRRFEGGVSRALPAPSAPFCTGEGTAGQQQRTIR